MHVSLYPDEENKLPDYEHVYNHLLQMEPLPVNKELKIDYFRDEEEEIIVFKVYNERQVSENGKIVVKQRNIAFDPWNQWLGITISRDALETFNELEIICHCFYWMTFGGFDEAQIQRMKDWLQKPSVKKDHSPGLSLANMAYLHASQN